MAKIKSRKTTTTAKGASPAKIIIIVAAVLLAIVAMLAISFGVVYASANSSTQVQRKFYVDVNGGRYYEGGDIQLKPHSITSFKCGYVTGNQSADKLYTVKITSTSTDKTAFTYTLNGAKRMFIGGEDYTDYFDITESSDGFEIAHVNDTPATILQRRYPERTVNAPETDPTVSYFTLTVTSSDNSQSVSFALTFGDIKIDVDPGGIIF